MPYCVETNPSVLAGVYDSNYASTFSYLENGCTKTMRNYHELCKLQIIKINSVKEQVLRWRLQERNKFTLTSSKSKSFNGILILNRYYRSNSNKFTMFLTNKRSSTPPTESASATEYTPHS